MGTVSDMGGLAFAGLIFLSLLATDIQGQEFGDAQLVYEWTSLEFDWPSEKHRNESLGNGTYVPNRNMVAGIKVYKDSVFVTIPRWFWTSGHPVTLAKVVTVRGEEKLSAYPTWAAQIQGDCNALQYVQGMEIDPNTGLMYVIDTGRVGDKLNLCPAKLVVFDLNTNSQHKKYELPTIVASYTSNFMNDIVLDYVGGKARFAYISDANDAHLIVVDLTTGKSWKIQHESMGIESKHAEMVTINNITYTISVALDGLAMSPDFKYLYYCSLAGFNLYQIPTSSLRTGKTDGIRLIGSKVSQSGGIGYGSKFLYYGALGLNAVYYWDSDKDMADQNVGMDKVTLATEKLLVRNDSTMQWPDTFGFDTRGWIWFVSNRLQVFREAKGLPQDGNDAYMRVWKVYVNETGYLYQSARRTEGTSLEQEGNGSESCFSYTLKTFFFHLFAMFIGAVLVIPEMTHS
ncbi:unnamed protein product [Candidula unifasciata]|uniref:Uncharacterized protein n=1 Tax=Candidula unifasciata TaxID=100452 RepID=A0A8S3ZH60_9EUPU|nr:unnamed protein product [Candidula unifasciata]